MPATTKKPGPSSRHDVLVRVDRRTRVGRMLRDVEAALVTHVGGNPSAAEAILIRAATLKVVRLNLLAEKLVDGDELAGDAHGALAWSNGLRRDLEVLGLRPRARDAMEDLGSYLAGRAA